MQTTLLGLAIALILALLAALVGPYFIDWNQFRPQFEAEAARIVGAPVRVAGALDARLLPTPSLKLRDVTIGGANDSGRVHAGRLDVQFSLGALMRGEWRADELSVNGVSLDLGLDSDGRLEAPLPKLAGLSALTIDRLNLTGRIALHHAASRTTVELDDIAFSGELRAQAASLRGDGNFVMGGSRIPFRLSAGRAADGKAMRLHLSLDQFSRGVSVDLDGLVAVEARSPRFDGTLALASLPNDKAEAAWRASAKLNADAAAAKFEQFELSYGDAEKASKLSGAGEVRFGAAPHLEATLSARQLDADRLLSVQPDSVSSAAWLPRLRQLADALPRPPMPANILVDAEQVTLGGRPLTAVNAQVRSDGQAWRIDRLNLRAPGGSVVALSGGGRQGSDFSATLDLQSADPELLAAWLSARPVAAGSAPKPLHAWGTVGVSTDGVRIDPVRLEVDGDTLSGRAAYRPSTADRGARVEIGLKGDSADLDAALNLLRSLNGADPQAAAAWPGEASVALDLGSARWGDRTWQPLVARFDVAAGSIALNQLKLGSAGVAVEAHGTFDRVGSTGHFALEASAPSLAAFADAAAPYAPCLAERMKANGDSPGPARAALALTLSASNANQGHVDAASSLTIETSRLKLSADLKAMPKIPDVRDFDVDALSRNDIALVSRITADRGSNLLRLLGVDRVLAAGEGAAQIDVQASGAWRSPLKFKAHLTGATLDAEADGRVEPQANGWSATEPKATLTLNARRLDLSPLLDAGTQGATPISLKSQLSVDGRKWTLGDIDAGIDGARLRGRLAVALGDQTAIDGEAGIDTLAVGSAVQIALGAAGRDREAPLGRGLVGGWRGRIAFQALRAQLPGGTELQPLAGVISNDGQALTITANGKLGGGDASSEFVARPADNGVAVTATLAVTAADGASLHHGDLALPADKASLQMTLASTGRSAAALTGALSGGGTATLERAHLKGLDPKAFDAAIAASDSGQPTDGDRLNAIVEPVLVGGWLRAERVQFPIGLVDGRVAVAPTTVQGDRVRATVSGGYDIAAGQADLRANLVSSTAGGPGAPPPEISIFAAGPPDRLARSLDVSALSTWLAVRRIDRETEKLQQLERGAPPAPPVIAPEANRHAPTPPGDSGPNASAKSGAQAGSAGRGASANVAPAPDTESQGAAPQTTEPQHVAPKRRLHAPRRPVSSQASNAGGSVPSARTVAPLPPPLDIRHAPGDSRLIRPRPPMFDGR